MAFSNAYTFGFATAVCVFCSVAVSGAAVALKDKQDLNRERDLHKSILEALQFPADELVGEKIDALWRDRVKLVIVKPDGTSVTEEGCADDLTGDGKCTLDDVTAAREAAKGKNEVPTLLALYERMDEGKVFAYAIPLYGQGLWGPVAGYVAIAPDLSQVVGSTFFAPKETPGLGAEIEQPPFEDQWKGKKIFQDGKPRGIRVAKGSAATTHPDEVDYWVDGISGATLTSRGVSNMSVDGIEKNYAQTLIRLKEGEQP